MQRRRFTNVTLQNALQNSKEIIETITIFCRYRRSFSHFGLFFQKSNLKNCFFFLSAAFGAMAVGASVSWSSPTGPRYVNDLEITTEQVPWVGSSLIFGAAAMCLITGYVTIFIGRKTTMLILVIPSTFGWMLIIFTKTITMLLVGRFLLGISAGGICMVAPIYMGEISQIDNRGMLSSFFQLFCTVGTLFVYVLGEYVTTSRLSVICSLIPLVFAVLILFCPESPTYLVRCFGKI